MDQSIFEAAGGMPAMRRIAAAWHAGAMADPLVAHPFSHGTRPDHEERLACYLAEALGGPPAYTEHYGSGADVARMHAGNGPHPELDDAAIRVFADAVTVAGIPEPAASRIRDYWAWATRGPAAAHHGGADSVPADEPVWSWGWVGPVDA